MENAENSFGYADTIFILYKRIEDTAFAFMKLNASEAI